MSEYREPTEGELNAMIAEQYPTMPDASNKEPCGGPRGGNRASREAIVRVLRGGRRLTVRQIAAALGMKTRGVHQTVCNAVYNRSPWIRRERVEADGPTGVTRVTEYVYFLAATTTTTTE